LDSPASDPRLRQPRIAPRPFEGGVRRNCDQILDRGDFVIRRLALATFLMASASLAEIFAGAAAGGLALRRHNGCLAGQSQHHSNALVFILNSCTIFGL